MVAFVAYDVTGQQRTRQQRQELVPVGSQFDRVLLVLLLLVFLLVFLLVLLLMLLLRRLLKLWQHLTRQHPSFSSSAYRQQYV